MKVYAVIVSPRAIQQIDEAKAWWERERGPAQAEAIDGALEAATRLLRQHPRLGQPLERRGACSDADRVYRLDGVRYFIAYRIDDARQEVVVTRFRHEARRPLRRL